MNKFIKLSFLAALTFISANVFGKDKDFSLSIGEVKQKTVHFGISNAKNVSIYVYNDDKNELFSERINVETAEKSYNMSNMAAGNYFLVAESDGKIEKYKITVDANQVVVDQSPISAMTKPSYTVDKNIVKLKMNDVIGDVRVSIYDTANNTYYSNDNAVKNGLIDLTFDLNPENAETYIISVEKGDDSFSRMITLK
ncbi:DUF3244 domain-containing protein [Epilithonimonas ginsengisoli]|uniref:DUF3244 domain-containing protein n=1 Tax=Epilithonimonas ginsengisoli TaxID=1245592 RepID=A0ABU4JIV9_9FLAO|nr:MULTISPECIES: DUF3244 domain-containing protein [Chryseobacterium group]MBV6880834.1 DUF3244 domain-containing protein [Epilithonimonas sp. FP105]MDW8549596.1 DUF3244 domain-containing protein [Epilithonimonas ginsengisoli]OAH76726.1 hypothetical protein AXA65_00125 [Chryseobacterium sp. FP211-J200]